MNENTFFRGIGIKIEAKVFPCKRLEFNEITVGYAAPLTNTMLFARVRSRCRTCETESGIDTFLPPLMLAV